MAAEGQELAGERSGAQTCLLDLLGVPALRIGVPLATLQLVGVADDDAQQVVEVMSDSSREPPDGFHLVRLAKLLFLFHQLLPDPLDLQLLIDAVEVKQQDHANEAACRVVQVDEIERLILAADEELEGEGEDSQCQQQGYGDRRHPKPPLAALDPAHLHPGWMHTSVFRRSGDQLPGALSPRSGGRENHCYSSRLQQAP